MRCRILLLALLLGGCTPTSHPHARSAAPHDSGSRGSSPVSDASTTRAPWLPLVRVADVPLPGKPVRFDYQALDAARGNLIIAHMNGASVVVVKARDGSLVKVVPGIPTPRGVVVADEVGRIFVTSSPDKLVILDATSFKVIAHVTTGSAPDGDGWDAKDRVVAVSDQGDGAVSLIAKSGSGARRQVSLGTETGNVVFDAKRGVFWVTVVKASPPNQLVSIESAHGKGEGEHPAARLLRRTRPLHPPGRR